MTQLHMECSWYLVRLFGMTKNDNDTAKEEYTTEYQGENGEDTCCRAAIMYPSMAVDSYIAI